MRAPSMRTVVEVGSGGCLGIAELPDRHPLLHVVAFLHLDRAPLHVREKAPLPVAMVDDNAVAANAPWGIGQREQLFHVLIPACRVVIDVVPGIDDRAVPWYQDLLAEPDEVLIAPPVSSEQGELRAERDDIVGKLLAALLVALRRTDVARHHEEVAPEGEAQLRFLNVISDRHIERRSPPARLETHSDPINFFNDELVEREFECIKRVGVRRELARLLTDRGETLGGE